MFLPIPRLATTRPKFCIFVLNCLRGLATSCLLVNLLHHKRAPLELKNSWRRQGKRVLTSCAQGWVHNQFHRTTNPTIQPLIPEKCVHLTNEIVPLGFNATDQSMRVFKVSSGECPQWHPNFFFFKKELCVSFSIKHINLDITCFQHA